MRLQPDVPVLTDGRVRLRAATEADAPAVVEQRADPESIRWSTGPPPFGLDDARALLDRQRAGWAAGDVRHWAIELVGVDPVSYAGVIVLRTPRSVAAAWDVGLALHPATRGRGAGSGALHLAVA